MNGFNLLKKNNLTSYLNALAEAEPYDDGDCVCLDIENGSADITLMYIKPMLLPGQDDIGNLIKALIELDYHVACRESSKSYYLETGYEFTLSYVEIETIDSLTLYYAGINVNTLWGAEFNKDETGQWLFGGLC
ncbi:hypothetical protein [Aliikangiella sp. G2MR2-5]|uniref:hypothetical protein n=1 Tax=Aliikangiella sp. G2MR2-5 TaxID=2788943 RepID=UPI0018AB1E2C|nr:hypothetical protein [Aliikangiella sp. G2MR2-5]